MKPTETPSILSQFDRLPPHDIAAEMSVLGSIITDKEIAEEVFEILHKDSFFQADHAIIFEIAKDLVRNGAIDGMLVRAEMDRRHILEECGGVQYLAQIIGCQPSSAHGVHYAKIVAEKSRQRGIISACNDAIRAAYSPHSIDPTDSIMAKLESAIASVRDRGTKDTIRRLDEIIDTALKERERKLTRYILTGLSDLDKLCGGIPIKGFTIIAAPAGMCKSTLCKQIALNAARSGIKVGIIAVEESCDKIAANYLANASGVDSASIIRNKLNADQWAKLWTAQYNLPGEMIFVDDAQFKLSSIEATGRRMVKKHGCGVLIVDHMHIVDGEGNENRTQEMGKISGGLKTMFKNLNVAGIAAAQVNRGWKKGEAPSLDYLRDSGNLGADGDLIFMLYRDDYFRWKEDPKNFVPDHELQIYVLKNKSGGEGMETCHFEGDRQSIVDRLAQYSDQF